MFFCSLTKQCCDPKLFVKQLNKTGQKGLHTRNHISYDQLWNELSTWEQPPISAKLRGKPRQRRRLWGRGRRLCVARGLCATCEAKIDDCLAAHQHQLLLLLYHSLHQHQLRDPSSTFHQLVLEGVSVGGLALVHKCVMCIGSGELSGREAPSHIQIHTCSVTARVCTASCLPPLFFRQYGRLWQCKWQPLGLVSPGRWTFRGDVNIL